MMELDHPNCIKCYEVLETPTHVVLALELAAGGDPSLYERPDKYTEADAAKNVKEMMDGLAYLHSRDIAHRDLKLENVPPAGPRAQDLRFRLRQGPQRRQHAENVRISQYSPPAGMTRNCILECF